MKTAGIILVAAGILSAGREWERQKRACVHELEYFYRFLQYLEQEIVYRQVMLPAAFSRAEGYAKGLSKALADALFQEVSSRQESFGVLWGACVRRIYGSLGLSQEELRIMEQAGEAFSLPRREMIGPQAKLDRQCLWSLFEQRQEQFRKDCRLFRCLSVMGSLFAVILLL